MKKRTLRSSLLVSVALLPSVAYAQATAVVGGQQAVTLQELDVVATTPTPTLRNAQGVLLGQDRDKLPQNTSVLTSADVNRVGTPSVLRALDERIGSISINNAQGNPFQPTITYRGFEASPLGGSPQGVAVYVNGNRFNTSFGDTVQWDLIPDIAVDRIELEGSNPAYGLNALGGALSVQLKNGFTYQGTELNLSGGSFGRFGGSFQHGQRSDNVGLYVAGTALSENGWRKHSPSRLRQFYGDLGVQAERGEFHLNFMGAINSLTGNGTLPVDLLAAQRNEVFTYPDKTLNSFGRIGLSGTYDITPTVTLQGNAYYGRFEQNTANGDAAEVERCEENERFLCSEGANEEQFFLRDRLNRRVQAGNIRTANFARLPAFAERFEEGGPYAFLNSTRTNTENFGVSVQTNVRETLFGLPNRFVLGGSYDGGRTAFTADNAIGGLTFDRGFFGPGVVVRSDDNSITPVSVKSSNDYGGIYLQNNTDLTDRLTLTLQGRFNMAKIILQDQIGTALNGNHYFQRFNPGVGATYKIVPEFLTAYGGYVEANRAPTPAELSCADPLAPCSLTNFFVGDPPLKQVISRTVEAGFRGKLPSPIEFGVLSWKAGVFRARNEDDITFVPSDITIGRAYFQNVGSTRRQGVEASLAITTPVWNAFVDYAFVDATFQSPLTLASGGNPFATPNPAQPDNPDANQIFVRRGDKLPGVAPHQVKVGVQYNITPEWRVGVLGRVATGKFLVGDESNLNKTTGNYAVIGFNTSYRVSEHFEVYGYVENALNAKYATFGTFSPVGEVPILALPNASSNRSLAPGAPIAAYGGMRIFW
ncbi:TonB-dependent receptor [Methylobacterium marchantiae]|uniref:TonB-dependent receptor n=1 Tax=Methylobacterium marchantiae TaxID=600331 RepID=A0ABW3WZ12_9HYPH|nr:Vitamin B12 transporter BtuB [Methylobacterium marchantiae]